MMNNQICRGFLFATLLLLCSCASIFQAGPDFVPVNSHPAGARVLIDNIPYGVTPCVVMVRRDTVGFITLDKEGYVKYTRRLRWRVNGSTFLNIFGGVFLGPIFFGVDYFNGNMARWEDNVFAELRKATP